MLKIENVQITGFEPAIRGMRNPMNSWDKSDSGLTCSQNENNTCDIHCTADNYCKPLDKYLIGPNDHNLMMKLANGGPVHAKYRRMLTVYLDITAPLYWWSEMDTYKVGTVRNSCSFMHKGTSRPYTIDDFSLKDVRIYECLNDLPTTKYCITYPYETDEFRVFTDERGRKYDVYKNGRVVCEPFEYTDTWGSGRTRSFESRELAPEQSSNGYYQVRLSGRGRKTLLLHRLVAEMWCEKPSDKYVQVNHIDGNKGNNSADNLEWVTPSENMQKSVEAGLHNNLDSYHRKYAYWKTVTNSIPQDSLLSFCADCRTFTVSELRSKYDLPSSVCACLKYSGFRKNLDLFMECDVWRCLIDTLNSLRELYLETKDIQVFQQIRCLMPQGYMQKSTVMLNYEVLANIYAWRRDHKLDEWHTFCDWIESLPYSDIITGEVQNEKGK